MSETQEQDTPRVLVKYMGTSDRRVIYGTEDFGGRLPDGIGRDLLWSWNLNQHVLDVGDLSEDTLKLLLAEPDFVDVTDSKRVALGGFQRTFLGMSDPEDGVRHNKYLPVGYKDIGIDDAGIYVEDGMPAGVRQVESPLPPEPQVGVEVNASFVEHPPHLDDEARVVAQQEADKQARMPLYESKPNKSAHKDEWLAFASALPGVEVPEGATVAELQDLVEATEAGDKSETVDGGDDA